MPLENAIFAIESGRQRDTLILATAYLMMTVH
jgi:hypothetical protein